MHIIKLDNVIELDNCHPWSPETLFGFQKEKELVRLEMRWHHSHFRSRPQKVRIAQTAMISSDSLILLKQQLRTRQRTRTTVSQLNYAEVVDSHDLQKDTIRVPRTFQQLLCLNPK